MNPALKPETTVKNYGRATQGADMRALHVTIPDGIEFADLRLSRDTANGLVRFEMAPVKAICKASALDPGEVVHGPRPIVGLVIALWYAVHLKRGGAPDPVQEDLIKEVRLEMKHGGGFTYPPGHA